MAAIKGDAKPEAPASEAEKPATEAAPAGDKEAPTEAKAEA